MKKTVVFLFVLLLSIIHVHLSIDTQDNGLNPLTIFMLIDSRISWISEKGAFVLGGILIQSVVTMIIARFILKWKNYPIWIIVFILCILIGVLSEDLFHMQLQTIDWLNSFYSRLYDTELPSLCSYAFLFSFIQIILLLLYPLGIYLVKTILKTSKSPFRITTHDTEG